MTAFFYLIRITITFYQTSRLQYTFSSEQIHSTKYGLSKCTFALLYFNVICFIVIFIISTIADIAIMDVKYLSGRYVCVSAEGETFFGDWMTLFFIWFLLWDWTVMGIYFYKCYQFARKNMDNVDDKVKLRIKFILSKISFLTILLEIEAAIFLVLGRLNAVSKGTGGIGLRVIGWMLISFDGLFCAYIVWLMLSHNDDKYVQFIKVLDRMKICCCFQWFINNVMLYSEEKQLGDVVIEEEKAKDLTYTDHNIPEKIQMEVSMASQM